MLVPGFDWQGHLESIECVLGLEKTCGSRTFQKSVLNMGTSEFSLFTQTVAVGGIKARD